MSRYARVERERRFLLAAPPAPAAVTVTRRIVDRYLDRTRLRLRRIEAPDGAILERKLTQKLPGDGSGAVRGLITTIYLSDAEYAALAVVPAAVLTKTRLSIPPLGVDVFDAPWHGLVLAEAEFDTDAEALAFAPPAGAVAEVTDDRRFAGGSLARARRDELLGWLAGYRLRPGPKR